MTPTQTMVSAIISAILTSSAWPYFGPKFIEWKNRKKTAEERHAQEAEERRERERDEWMEEAKDAYERVNKSCDACRKELERVKREELEPLKRDYAAIKDALLGRIEAIEEILPHVTGLSPEKIDELRRANRAQRSAAFRGKW